MGFSRQEYWSGLPFPSPGDLPNPGIEPGSPALQADTNLWATREKGLRDQEILCITSSCLHPLLPYSLAKYTLKCVKYEPRVPGIGKKEEWVQKEGHLKGGDVEKAKAHRQTPTLQRWDFPGSSVVKTCFHRLGPQFYPWLIYPTSCKAWLRKKKKHQPNKNTKQHFRNVLFTASKNISFSLLGSILSSRLVPGACCSIASVVSDSLQPHRL